MREPIRKTVSALIGELDAMRAPPSSVAAREGSGAD
jgi:hypothetical protein